MALLVVVGSILASLGSLGQGLSGITIAQVAIIAGVPLAMAFKRHGRGGLRALGVTRPGLRAVAGAALCGASFWYINWQVIAPLGQHLLGGEGELRHLEQTVASAPLPWVLVTVALLPAVCEELLLRGLVLPSFQRSFRSFFLRGSSHPMLGSAIAVVASAALFSLLHLTRIQLLPTFAFGLVLGHAALHCGVLPGMVIHLLNNTVALVLATGGLDFVEPVLSDGLVALLPLAIALCAAGLWLLRTHPHGAGESTNSA